MQYETSGLCEGKAGSLSATHYIAKIGKERQGIHRVHDDLFKMASLDAGCYRRLLCGVENLGHYLCWNSKAIRRQGAE